MREKQARKTRNRKHARLERQLASSKYVGEEEGLRTGSHPDFPRCRWRSPTAMWFYQILLDETVTLPETLQEKTKGVGSGYQT